MTLTSIIRQNHLREQRLQFIRAHQNAFDVEPSFPLQLFEDFVVGVEGDCTIEASCKVEFDKLIASRFLLFLNDSTQSFASKIAKALNFFHQVEKRVNLKINYDLLQQFMAADSRFDFEKVHTLLSCGIDLRSDLSEASLKMHFRIDSDQQDAEASLELVESALTLSNPDRYSLELWDTFSQLIPKYKLISLIGFDFYLNGHSDIELYLEIMEEDFQRPEIRNLLQQSFSESVLAPLKNADIFYIGLSQANANPVLYFRLKRKQDLLTNFRVNSAAQRVHSFYQQQVTLPHIWVGVAEQELQNSWIENIRLYYHRGFFTDETD